MVTVPISSEYSFQSKRKVVGASPNLYAPRQPATHEAEGWDSNSESKSKLELESESESESESNWEGDYKSVLVIMGETGVIMVLIILGILTFLSHSWVPVRFDGFVYRNNPVQAGSDIIFIEAFFDPVCPDSRDAWGPLKKIIDFYGDDRISLTLHPFPLPYHDNAFLSCRALHVINKLNSSATYDLLELIFDHQMEFYNKPTFNMPRESVVNQMANLATEVLDNSYKSTVASGFSDPKTDSLTRISFKYGCSRGVSGTPFFFVNGFQLPDAGSAIDYPGWKKIIEPLIEEQDTDKKEDLYSSL